MMTHVLLVLSLTTAQSATPPPAKTPGTQTTGPQTAGPQTSGAQKPADAARPGAARTTPSKAATDALRTQVMLDRAGFSPGVIDGKTGPSTRKALEAYQKQAGSVTETTSIEPVTRYQITDADVKGPFVDRIPQDLVDQAKLPHLGYTSPLEAIAERFHTTPAFLQRLNPGAKFAAGEEIDVPNVVAMMLPTATETVAEQKERARGRGEAVGTAGSAPQDVVVTVSKSGSSLTVTDGASGRVLLYAPVTTGSERDPLPIGEWKVTGVSLNPPFNYNPNLFWDSNPKDTKAKIPAGPNNPVGVVWIDLSKEHYGIHGTPEPSNIGRTQSHGCVRLTNWDALNVATLVRPGTRVVFTQ